LHPIILSMTDDHSSRGSHVQGASERRVGLAALLIGSFMLVEVAGGFLSGSLALLADAGHMVTDFASLTLAWYGFRLSRRPADWKRTYGYDRFSVLVAFVNGLALFVIAAWIASEAWQRLSERPVVLAGMMFWVALAGLAVNVLAFWVLQGGDRKNLNIRAAALHVAGDLLGSIAALAAAIVIMTTGWMPIDPILSILVALIIVGSAWRVVGESSHILLEGAPSGHPLSRCRRGPARNLSGDRRCAPRAYLVDYAGTADADAARACGGKRSTRAHCRRRKATTDGALQHRPRDYRGRVRGLRRGHELAQRACRSGLRIISSTKLARCCGARREAIAPAGERMSTQSSG
jgi:cobalt-zinc-cadmium efflux system protein